MAGKVLAGAGFAPGSGGDPSQGTEFVNRPGVAGRSKTLPGYTGRNLENPDQQAGKDSYLHEEDTDSISVQEQALLDQPDRNKAVAAEEVLPGQAAGMDSKPGGDGASMEASDTPLKDAADLESVMDDEERERAVREYRIHMELLYRQFHQAMEAEIRDEVQETRNEMHQAMAIENTKKNALDYAVAVYGDDADLGSIVSGADRAQSANRKEITGTAGLVSHGINKGLGLTDDVIVRTPNGAAVPMRRSVAVAMDVYSHGGKAAGPGMGTLFQDYVIAKDPAFAKEMQAAGDWGKGLDAREQLKCSQAEMQQLTELQSVIREYDSGIGKFAAERSRGFTQDEYESKGLGGREAERRLPAGGAYEQYVFTKEGTYEYNGRKLPDAYANVKAKEREASMGGPSLG